MSITVGHSMPIQFKPRFGDKNKQDTHVINVKQAPTDEFNATGGAVTQNPGNNKPRFGTNASSEGGQKLTPEERKAYLEEPTDPTDTYDKRLARLKALEAAIEAKTVRTGQKRSLDNDGDDNGDGHQAKKR